MLLTGDWAPEAAKAISLCIEWSKTVTSELSCQVYLFGSAIYENGDQFDAQLSDLDIVCVFNDEPDATRRLQRLMQLRNAKFALESQLLPQLHRINCTEPGVSIVPVSSVEVETNVHKSGARRFFDQNIFFDLSTEKISVGLDNAGSSSIAYEARQALEYAQKIRNAFLSVAANATGGLEDFDGPDPLPKSMCRVAAQLIPHAEPGTWYDTRFGLEYIWDELSRRRAESTEIGKLYRKVSIRRGGRGRRVALDGLDQLLLAELIFDRAAAFPIDQMLVWEIRFVGAAPSGRERDRIIQSLHDIVPDGEVLAVREGSIVVKIRSSKRAYDFVRKLDDMGVLQALFDVKSVSIAEVGVDGFATSFETQEPVDIVARSIREWRPYFTEGKATEADFIESLAKQLSDNELLGDSAVGRNVLVSGVLRAMRVDLVVRLYGEHGEKDVAIEVVRLKQRSRFFDVFDRVRAISVPTILVVVATDDVLQSLVNDFHRIHILESTIRILTVTV